MVFILRVAAPLPRQQIGPNTTQKGMVGPNISILLLAKGNFISFIQENENNFFLWSISIIGLYTILCFKI